MRNIKKVLYTFMFLLTFIYIFWRTFFTLPVNLGFIPILFGFIILFVEIWDFFDFFVYYINILMGKKKKVPSINTNISNLPEVDIFIATYNESENVLRKTIEGCLNLEYDAQSKIHIYLCDDGNRPNIKKLASSYNINYFAREKRNNAKAGNYNNALNRTTSPYIATFDADMVPEKDFLLSSIPYFMQNEKLGFVQFPQTFYNPDIFQYRFYLENEIPYEQSYFYNDLQSYKNTINSAIYCGTNTVFSRKALKANNGFATGTLSEDIATGMLVEAKGYECLALTTTKAIGESVLDLQGFLKQRSRWAKGCIQMSKKYNILHLKGLSLRQKLEYLSCVSYWFFGFRRLIYLIAPTLFAIFGIITINCDLKTFLILWLPSYLLKRYMLDILSNKKRSSTWSKIYETILAPNLGIDVIKEYFFKTNSNFDVTPKSSVLTNNKNESRKLLLKHLSLLLINLIGIIFAIFKITQTNMAFYIISFMWMFSNIFYLLISIKFDISNRTSNYIINDRATKYKYGSIFKIFFHKKGVIK